MKITLNYSWGYQSYDGWVSNSPNSAGGVSVRYKITNNTSKTMKYIELDFTPYNSVFDDVGCNIKRVSNRTLQLTGPLYPDKGGTVTFENVWYNSTISGIRLTGARVQYMDGTSEIIPLSEINSTRSYSDPGGCYVATAVYGSYDCPQVWTLRRYRDNTLARSWYGRAFIYTYYAVSPTLVKWFGDTDWFKKMWRGKLDRMVENLKKRGVDDTPYEDKEW